MLKNSQSQKAVYDWAGEASPQAGGRFYLMVALAAIAIALPLAFATFGAQ